MSEAVIDLLEVVQIEYQQAKIDAVTLAIGHGNIQLRIHGAPVADTGQRIDGGLAGQQSALNPGAVSKHKGKQA